MTADDSSVLFDRNGELANIETRGKNSIDQQDLTIPWDGTIVD